MNLVGVLAEDTVKSWWGLLMRLQCSLFLRIMQYRLVGAGINTGFGKCGLLSIFLRKARSAMVDGLMSTFRLEHSVEKVGGLLGSQRP